MSSVKLNIGTNRNSILAECKGQWQSYQLFLVLQSPLLISHPRWQYFPAGWYVYVGSGKTNIFSRIHRHLRRQKKIHWHIDYLTTHPSVRIAAIAFSTFPECRLVQLTPGEVLHPGFGATDCKQNCISHLRYLDGAC